MKKFHSAAFALQALKAISKGVFRRSYCYYGNLSCHENHNNLFTDDLPVFSIQIIVASTDKEWL